MATVEYAPKGNKGFKCALTTRNGYLLRLEADLVDLQPNINGDDRLTWNAALVENLLAYGSHEAWFRRFQLAEKKESHRKQADRHLDVAKTISELCELRDGTTHDGWCSACLRSTTHEGIDGRIHQARTHLCLSCGSPTTPCMLPGCKNFANRSNRSVTIPGYCAEHRHDIPSFDRLTERLDAIEDYSEWLRFEKANAKRISQVAGGAVMVAGAVMPVAYAAAPFIGGATGALTGLTGAAATSHGLAMWGFGSLAAGGFGMAGGTMVITAVGAALGGTFGAVTTTAYVGSDRSFAIEKLRDGRGLPVLLATGFMTEGGSGWGPWRRLIDERYPDSPVYRVIWGASELKALNSYVQGVAGPAMAARGAAQFALKASRAARLGPLAAVLAASNLAKNPWTVAKNRAGMTGAVLADLIARTDQGPFVLVGHSLGARVMATTAQTLATTSGEPKLHTVHLLGAAISKNGDWRTLNDSVSNRVWNYHSRRDSVLATAFKIAQLGQKPVGLIGFGSKHPNIRDRDVSKQVGGHSEYFAKIKLAADKE